MSLKTTEKATIAAVIILAGGALWWSEWGLSILTDSAVSGTGDASSFALDCRAWLGTDFTGPANTAVDAARDGDTQRVQFAIDTVATVVLTLRDPEIRKTADQVSDLLLSLRSDPGQRDEVLDRVKASVHRSVVVCDRFL